MIPNATLISYTSPAVPDARGGRTPGIQTLFPARRTCAVCDPSRAHLISLANKVVGMTGVIYIDLANLAGMPVPEVGGQIAYTLHNTTGEATAEILHRGEQMHAGLSHYELAVKQP
jgi:hypothetical protein